VKQGFQSAEGKAALQAASATVVTRWDEKAIPTDAVRSWVIDVLEAQDKGSGNEETPQRRSR
jgi:hypothetical protein